MKSTGIVRKIDRLGRIVLPVELRRTLDISEKDPLEIFVKGGSVILKKYVPENNSNNQVIFVINAIDFILGWLT